MLSRWRSVSVTALPGSYNNPVQRFEEAAQHRQALLQGCTAASSGLPITPDSLRTSLRLWDGPLAGIAHQAGQFIALEEGPAAEEATLPPEDLARGLSLDLDLLVGFAELTRDVLYSAYGSESDFNVVPIILEPRLDVSKNDPATGGDSHTAEHSSRALSAASPPPALPSEPPRLQPSQPELLPSSLPPAAATAAAQPDIGPGSASGCGCGWWSLEKAVATPLSWEEVAASMGVAPELAALVAPPPQAFDSKQAFLSHLMGRHVAKLEGGEALALGGPAAEGPADSWVAANVSESAAAAGAGGRSSFETIVRCGGQEDPDPAVRRRRLPLTAAAALAAAVQELADAVVFPAALQVAVGSEALGWNPIPLLWLGRSRRSGAILGLLTAVVWT